MTRRRTDNDGSATIHAATIVFLMTMLGVVSLQVAALARVQHTVTAAADLAALAAADAAAAGGDGCSAAREVARRNHATMTACRLDEAAATLEVSGTTAEMWGRTWTITRTARAAPSDYRPART